MEAVLMRIADSCPSTRALIKWLIHWVTWKCEIERICDQGRVAAHWVFRLESSLLMSKSSELRMLAVSDNLDLNQACQLIIRVKNMIPEKSVMFLNVFPLIYGKILQYNKLITVLSTFSSTPYDSQNSQHESMLMEVWTSLRPDETLEARKTSQWSEIGFQGKDPQTDFRGMGLLGLMCLHHLCLFQGKKAAQMYSQSLHPVHGYPFAITVINVGFMAFQMVRMSEAKHYFYNSSKEYSTVEEFYDFFVMFMVAFNHHWVVCEPTSIMQFGEVKEKFLLDMRQRLKNNTIDA